MADRDVERDVTGTYFVDVLRRLADAIDRDEPFRIQVAGTRFTVPGDAVISLEHEVEEEDHELEFQLKWRNA